MFPPTMAIDGRTEVEASDGLVVRILRDHDEFIGIRDFWASCPGTRDSDIDVVLTAIQRDPAIQRPYVLVAEVNHAPVALMVGWIVLRHLPFRVGYFNLFNPLVRAMIFPYGALRGNSSLVTSERFVRAIVRSLKSGEADLAILEHLDVDSDLYRWGRRVPGILTRDHCAAHRYHRMRSLPVSADEFYASLSANERRNLRRIQRKLSKDFAGNVRIEHLQHAADLDRTLDVIGQISRKTWQEKIGHGLSAVGVQRDLFMTQAQQSWLRTFILYVGDQPCAFWIGAVYQGTFYSDFTGYDPAYSQYHPGMYLLSQMIESFCAEGITTFDFGFSDEEWKRRFENKARRMATLNIFATSPKGLALSALRSTTYLLHEPVRSWLARTGGIERAKKIARRIARASTDKSKP